MKRIVIVLVLLITVLVSGCDESRNILLVEHPDLTARQVDTVINNCPPAKFAPSMAAMKERRLCWQGEVARILNAK